MSEPILPPLKHSQRYLKFFKNPLPLRRGRVRVGVDKIETVQSPLPFIPSRRREGRILGNISEKVRDKFSDFLV